MAQDERRKRASSVNLAEKVASVGYFHLGCQPNQFIYSVPFNPTQRKQCLFYVDLCCFVRISPPVIPVVATRAAAAAAAV